MASPHDRDLEELRREVDRVDRAMVELLADRLRIVQEIAAIKATAASGGPAIRPAREAVILRRLVAQAGSRFPAGTLVRMWRELLSATTRAQAPLAVVACVPSCLPQLWDLARDHFGSAAPISPTPDWAEALRLVAIGEADLAVLPLPSARTVWWANLAEEPLASVRVVARLPFGPPGAQLAGFGAMVVGRVAPEPTGADASLFALDTPVECDLTRLATDSELSPRPLARLDLADGRTARQLLEVDGFSTAEEPKLARMLEAARWPILRSAWLGSYARPLAAGE